jgi:hypothetical protein
MNSLICPYLGLKDDPGTVLDFPSEGNICHRAQSKPEINREYQRCVCLLAEHINCPVFVGTGEGPLPVGLIAPHPLFSRYKPILWLVIPGILILAGFLLSTHPPGILQSFAVQSYSAWKTLDLSNILSIDWQRNQGGSDKENLPSSGNETAPASGENGSQPFSPFDEMITPGATDPSLVPCKPPSGWVAYVVKPTDSLFRLSLVFGVRIIDLQTVNCMTDNNILHPGDTIYVPSSTNVTPIQSPTPILATPTPTPRSYLPPIKPTRGSKPQATRPPVSTPVPPTATSKPTNTSAPPPTNPPPPTNTPIPTKPPPPTPTSAPPL